MSFRSWFAQRQLARAFDLFHRDRRRSPRRSRVSHFGLPAEVLEIRTLLSNFTAASTSALIADIAAANQAGGASTITLAANTTFDLTAVNNTTNGANGLPVIGANKAVNLTIVGNGDTIDRSAAAGTPAFRLLDVASGSSLTLESVTLQNGLATGSGTAAEGGAIFNQGSLTLIGATVQNNAAEGTNGADGLVTQKKLGKAQTNNIFNGQAGGAAAGGGIWSSGSVTLEGGSVLQQNQALGGQGGAAGASLSHTGFVLIAGTAGAGGAGLGGGLYEAGGTLNVSSALVQANRALGGAGGAEPGPLAPAIGVPGGDADGGGIDVAGGAATLAGSQLLSNEALGGEGGESADGGRGGNAIGGGLDAAGGTVTLTNDTVTGNSVSGGPGGLGTSGDASFGPGPGSGVGGGIAIASATVSLDSFTVNNTSDNVNNTYYGTLSNIDGTYILLP